MFGMLKDLIKIADFRAGQKVESAFSVELIDLKIRESSENLNHAKRTLAALVMRLRAEEKSGKQIAGQIADLENRTSQAMTGGNQTLALEGAEAIAELENELVTRNNTIGALKERVARIQFSIEKAHRRLVSLQQGAIAAKAAVAERKAQLRVDRSLLGASSFNEAEALIEKVTGQSDPFEEAGILDEIDDKLTRKSVRDRLADAGFGAPAKSKAEEVLARLAAKAAEKPAA